MRNLGDDIQSLAARQYLPHVDALAEREALNRYDGPEAKIILNGWFMEDGRNWPPSERLIPLITSFHISQARRNRLNWWRPSAKSCLLSPQNKQFLKVHGPVGARDEATRDLLLANGIDSYFSGCLTLTLKQPRGTAPSQRIIACDLSDTLFEALSRRCNDAPIRVSHHIRDLPDNAERFRRAEDMLALYASAKAVVTSRVHSALPCLAMGTPVLFIPEHIEKKRQSIASQLAHHCNSSEFLEHRDGFDPNNPPPNPQRHVAIANALAAQCETFIGSSPSE